MPKISSFSQRTSKSVSVGTGSSTISESALTRAFAELQYHFSGVSMATEKDSVRSMPSRVSRLRRPKQLLWTTMPSEVKQ